MTGWLIIVALVIAIMAILIFVAKIPRGAWEFTAAALTLGLAGYAWQGHPGYAGAPTSAADEFGAAAQESEEARLDLRKKMDYEFSGGRSWLVLADSQSRSGDFVAAAKILHSAIAKQPGNADLWVALGNALAGQSGGFLTPASRLAYERAAAINPNHPGPPFFMGLALAQEGQLDEARILWQDLLARTGPDAPWRDNVTAGLARIDAVLEADTVSQTRLRPGNASQ